MILVPVLAAFAAFSGIATWQRLETRQNRLEGAGRIASIRFDLNNNIRLDKPAEKPIDLTPLIEKLPRGVVVEAGWDGADWLVTSDQLPDDRGPRLVGTQVAEAASGSRHGARYVVTQGRLPRIATEMFLSEPVARLGPWKIGDTVESARSRQRFEIVGIGAAGDNVERRVVVVADQPESFWSAPSGNVGTVSVSDADYDKASTESWRDVGIWASSPMTDQHEDAVKRAIAGYAAGSGSRSFGRTSTVRNLSASTSGGLVLLTTGLAAMVAVVTSAAFAIASRRQLRGIGLLATAGADPATIRAALVLQGAIPGLIAGVSAIALGFLVRPWVQGWLTSATNVSGAEVVLSFGGGVLAVVLGVGAGVGAAWIPARTASRIPLLSALAGRRPLGPVPTRVPVRGLVAVAVGLVAIGVATRRTSTAVSSGETALIPLIGIAAILAVIFGLLATAPTLVALLGKAAGRATGTTRLALRGLARHRTQSTATVAAVAICLALPVAFLTGRSAAADMNRTENSEHEAVATPTSPSNHTPAWEQVDLRRNSDGLVVVFHGDLASPDTPSVVAETNKVIGPSGATVSVVAFTNGTGGWNAIASIDPAAAEKLLVPWAAAQIKAGGAIALRGQPGPLVIDDGAGSISVNAIGVPETKESGPAGPAGIGGLEADYLMATTTFGDVGAGRPPIQLVTLRAKPATKAEESKLWFSQTQGYNQSNGCCPTNPTLAEIRSPAGGSPVPTPDSRAVWVELVSGSQDSPAPLSRERGRDTVDRLFLALAGGSTALALLVLTITLSLRAVDSQDDHRAAVAVGAPPAKMRRQQALEGMVLAGLGALLAAPLGWLPVIAFRFGSIRRIPTSANDSWVDAITQRLHFPGWQVVPVMVAPALIAGVLWLIVPAVRAALIRRPQDEMLQRA